MNTNSNDIKSSGLIGQRQERIEKLQKLKQLGIDPYPAKARRTHTLKEIVANFEGLEGNTATLAGRLTSWREHGKLVFADLEDGLGKLQLYIKQDAIADTQAETQTLGWNELALLDVGDFVEASGEIVKTQRGEISILVKNLRLLTKSLRPLPEKWQGLTDKEERYRRRYLDLATNSDARALFLRKSKFWESNREFLKSKGFIEVETPVLEEKTGGADARPFITHHNDLDQDFYMRISTELYQKRLIGGGFEKIFTLGPNFRNEGTSDEHLQEYYQIEWYWAYADYKDNMNLVRDMIRKVAQDVYGRTKFTSRGHTFDLADEWVEIDYAQIISEKLGIDIFKDTEEKMLAVIKENNVKLGGEVNRNRLIDNLWKLIRKTIPGPAFLINEPKFMSPLAKSRPDNAELTERFHVIIAGSELGNGYSEINDPIDQLERFLDQEKMRVAGDDEAQMLDIDYVEMLEYGMPPVSGYGHSERIFWYLEDISAREGTLFPLMRREIDPLTKKIYGDAIKDKPAKVATTEIVKSAAPINYPSLAEAEKLLLENVPGEYQRHHSRMVSAAMEEYAKILSERNGADGDNYDSQLWGITGLIHDWDYAFDPEGHPERNLPKLTELGYPGIVTEAIMAHKVSPDYPATTAMAKALIAIDEMSGLLFAYNKFKNGYANMDVKGVRKRFKDKAFAAKINRDDIMVGVDALGISLDEHIANLIRIFSEREAQGSLRYSEN